MTCPPGWDSVVIRQLDLVQIKRTQDDCKDTNGEETYREQNVYNKGRGKKSNLLLVEVARDHQK